MQQRLRQMHEHEMRRKGWEQMEGPSGMRIWVKPGRPAPRGLHESQRPEWRPYGINPGGVSRLPESKPRALVIALGQALKIIIRGHP
jgi:hypothetical protein